MRRNARRADAVDDAHRAERVLARSKTGRDEQQRHIRSEAAAFAEGTPGERMTHRRCRRRNIESSRDHAHLVLRERRERRKVRIPSVRHENEARRGEDGIEDFGLSGFPFDQLGFGPAE